MKFLEADITYNWTFLEGTSYSKCLPLGKIFFTLMDGNFPGALLKERAVSSFTKILVMPWDLWLIPNGVPRVPGAIHLLYLIAWSSRADTSLHCFLQPHSIHTCSGCHFSKQMQIHIGLQGKILKNFCHLYIRIFYFQTKMSLEPTVDGYRLI